MKQQQIIDNLKTLKINYPWEKVQYYKKKILKLNKFAQHKWTNEDLNFICEHMHHTADNGSIRIVLKQSQPDLADTAAKIPMAEPAIDGHGLRFHINSAIAHLNEIQKIIAS